MLNIPTPRRTGISRIPPEILGEIFVHCLPPDSPSQNTQQLLSSVCRIWRAIALITPALWASLDITCDMDVLLPPLPIIRTHLQCSRTHPLSFILHFSNLNHLHILTELTAARQRWCNVHIELYVVTQGILDLITLGDAPLLQSMQCDVMEGPSNLPIPLGMLHHCPRLESFQWDSFESPALMPLGDTRLTSLSLRAAISTSECITLLRLSPRLSNAEFYSFYPRGSLPTPHLTHPTLCTLTAIGDHSTTLLDALTLPALLNLDLVETAPPRSTLWETTMSAFLERSNPKIHTFSLSMSYMRRFEAAVLRILILTPHLRGLNLSDSRSDSPLFTAALIRALHPLPPPCVPLLPHLRQLQLSRIVDCPDGLCGTMLRARRGAHAQANGVACLEWAHIWFVGGVHDRDEADMKELCAEGMQGMID
ncbi:hypothetical protein BD779DRAFT_1670115 [Infundibulicybe gibba]|nr:hypothetical protein BD779DRAFT_1670115 [Infundibulicybe gibba]